MTHDTEEGCECGKNECGCGPESSGCECGQDNCSCGPKQGCCGSNGCEDECDELSMLFGLAHEAKMGLLKEKMKKKFEATHGAKFEKLATLIVDAMLMKHKAEKEKEEAIKVLREKIDAIWDSE